jgi:hypothetical protein
LVSGPAGSSISTVTGPLVALPKGRNGRLLTLVGGGVPKAAVNAAGAAVGLLVEIPIVAPEALVAVIWHCRFLSSSGWPAPAWGA